MSTPPKNISSDDAAIFQASLPADNPDSDNGDDTEDPVGRGASKFGQLDMFHGFPPTKVKTGVRPTSGEPVPYGFQMTPGAKKDECLAPTSRAQKRTNGRRFA